MTTTLRPTAPLHRSADGARSRPYQVCVNSRPVGAIELAADPAKGPGVGQIRSLYIEEPDRRRGRGTVAALAAEEVLRSWRCTQVEAQIPAGTDADTARRLATALGYVERNRAMAKDLAGPAPTLPEGCSARPMAEEEYPAWLEDTKAKYVRMWIERGLSEEEAYAKSEQDHAQLLPDGLGTPDMWITCLLDGGEVAGTIWVAGQEGSRYVYWVQVTEEFRGRGHGRTLMNLAERDARAAGVGRLALNVYTHNTSAVRLYESLGYQPVSYTVCKPL
ncbi:GNAT family N-acetyltransferase [Streptomyces sp. TRM66268-LWL]|uniref:GNAT family N-acetyltransferase n=1 Tax=Streptomyces polyasparticus TaxID=2767826 RepID=A0ABR7SJB9_9ACTN|nr:GNAT family N-acetyltransferase [Streptomyces polyasparticus]MBC9715595.1 GNAT family N-acetyltransferase [Streptomyces polyasparticus]